MIIPLIAYRIKLWHKHKIVSFLTRVTDASAFLWIRSLILDRDFSNDFYAFKKWSGHSNKSNSAFQFSKNDLHLTQKDRWRSLYGYGKLHCHITKFITTNLIGRGLYQGIAVWKRIFSDYSCWCCIREWIGNILVRDFYFRASAKWALERIHAFSFADVLQADLITYRFTWCPKIDFGCDWWQGYFISFILNKFQNKFVYWKT